MGTGEEPTPPQSEGERESLRRRNQMLREFQLAAMRRSESSVGHAVGSTAPKPIDRMLSLAAIAAGVVLWLIQKTPLSVSIGGLVIFACLVHPVWNFWWIEKGIVRRTCSLAVVAGVIALLCLSSLRAEYQAPVVSVQATPMVRYYGAPWGFYNKTNGKHYLSSYNCYANFGAESITVWHFNEHALERYPLKNVQIRDVVNRLNERIAQDENVLPGQTDIEPPSTIDVNAPCNPTGYRGTTAAFSRIDSAPMDDRQWLEFKDKKYALFFVGELYQRGSRGATRDTYCYYMLYLSAEIDCPGPGSH